MKQHKKLSQARANKELRKAKARIWRLEKAIVYLVQRIEKNKREFARIWLACKRDRFA